MNNSLSKPASHSPSNTINPFARALAEARGGESSDSSMSANKNQADQDQFSAEQQRQQLENLRRQRMQDQLQREVNPVENHKVYDQQQEEVKREINEIRHSLQNDFKIVKQEMEALQVELTLETNIVKPGLGTYFKIFFAKIGSLIRQLRADIGNAGEWATAFHGKKGKSSAPGMQISGRGYQQTKTVFDRGHHERSTAYAGS